MKRRVSFVVLIIALSVSAASANTTSECEQQLTPATMVALRGLYNKSVSPLLTPEQRVMARSLYTQKLEAAAAAYSTTMERLHKWVINQNELSTLSVNDSSNPQSLPIDRTLSRRIIRPHIKHLLHGHEDSVKTAIFSPDGQKVVTTSDDRTARIWNVSTGEQLLTLSGQNYSIEHAVFSPDGKRIVTASNDDTARIWDAITGKETHTLVGHKDKILSIAFSTDGKRVITASKDHTMRIWSPSNRWNIFARIFNVIKGQKIHKFNGHRIVLKSATVSPDGTKVITTSGDMTARIWDTATGKQLRLLLSGPELFNAAALSHNGTKAVTISGQIVRIWNVETGKLIHTIEHKGFPYIASFSPDDTKVITASWYGSTLIWDATSGENICQLEGPREFLHDASFSTDGTKVVTASGDSKARIWDLYTTEEELLSVPDTEGNSP